MDEIKKLPEDFRRNNYNYVQVRRGKNGFIYAQKSMYTLGKIIAWEVFVRKVSPAVEVEGNLLPDRERIPGNNDFGSWAWSFSDYDRAIRRFNYIEAQTDPKMYRASIFWENRNIDRPVETVSTTLGKVG